MSYEKLEQNMIDVIQEGQIKLGYHDGKVRLYYPVASLCHMLHLPVSVDELSKELTSFAASMEEKYGQITFEISSDKERVCLIVPAKGSAYVYENIPQNEFLKDFIDVLRQMECTIEDVMAVFHRYSDSVHAEPMEHEEFDYLVYFEDGVPDPYWYCLTDEGCRVTYHRFNKEDYEELMQSEK